jgi:hypothetical protein
MFFFTSPARKESNFVEKCVGGSKITTNWVKKVLGSDGGVEQANDEIGHPNGMRAAMQAATVVLQSMD